MNAGTPIPDHSVPAHKKRVLFDCVARGTLPFNHTTREPALSFCDMTEIERIEDQLKRAFEGPAWHGPSVTEALADITAAQAFAHPISGAHSIAELVQHIRTWESAVLRSVAGDGEVTVTEDENWPAVGDTSEAAWHAMIVSLVKNHLELTRVVAHYDPRRLDEVPPGAKSTAYVLLHGVIQHDIWHAAQIVLLRKGM